MSNYKKLTYEQRCQIETLKKSKMTQQEIANVIGVSQSTISRELKRARPMGILPQIGAEIADIMTQLNQRPRKTLGFKTPEELMHNYLTAIAV
jgi:IS30 family transposase